jgi:hypothetical protein
VEFIKHRGEDLTSEEEILDIIDDVDVCLELDDQVRRAWKAEHSHNHDEKRYEPKGKEESSTSTTTTTGNNKESSACKLHDGAHLWKDCPDNKWNKNRKEQLKAETVEKKKESGGIHSIALTTKKSPVVGFGKPVPDDLEDETSDNEYGL